MFDKLVDSLRDHDRHAVHDHDDDCETAANAIEYLRARVYANNEALAKLQTHSGNQRRELKRLNRFVETLYLSRAK